MPPPPVLLVIAGPAGSGKSTLCDRLVTEEPAFSRVVTTTTRTPRDGEINGVHYHFFAPDEFRRKVDAGEFLEWALVHGDRHDRLYGTLKSSVLEPLAAGTSLVVATALSAPALLVHSLAGDVDWTIALVFGLGLVPGALVGSRVAQHLPVARLRVAFGFSLVLVACWFAAHQVLHLI